VEGVPSINLGPRDPPVFIGRDAQLKDAMQKVMQWYEARPEDYGDSFRIPPMSLTRYVRGGKTRMLKEIGQELLAKGIPAIYVTFNDITTASRWERDNEPPPLQRLLSRIGWAVATDEARGLVDNNFNTWTATMDVSEDTVADWLGQHGCVLLIDELNKLITNVQGGKPGEAVAGFLKDSFIDRRNRYLIFSSHSTATGNKLAVFIQSPSDRHVVRPSLPVITTPDEATCINQAARKGAVCYLGLTPALVHEAYNEMGGSVHDCAKDTFSRLAAPPLDTATVECVIMMSLEGDMRWVEGLAEWSQALDAFVGGPVGTDISHTWPPCFLAAACDRLSRATRTDITLGVRQGTGLIRDGLRQLAEADDRSGKQWEGACQAAIIQRMLQSDLMGVPRPGPTLSDKARQLLPPCILDGLCSFGGTFEPTGFGRPLIRPDRTADIPYLRELVEREAARKGLHQGQTSLFVRPAVSDFPAYDFFIFILNNGRVEEIWGYQCKTGKEKPSDEQTRALTDEVDVSVWLKGEAGSRQTRSQYGYIIASRAAIEDLFGFSLRRTCPLRWLLDPRVWVD